MAFLKLITLAFATSIIVEAKWYQHQKRETTINICESVYNNTSEIQCYCVTDTDTREVRSATCHLTINDIPPNNKAWEGFKNLKDLKKLTISTNRGIAINYIPVNIFKYLYKILKIEIKYGNIETIDAFAFSNMTTIEEITLSDNQIQTLAPNAFSNDTALISIGLDMNNIVEINRNVFINLPSLQKLFLTNNKITTIHDKAFVHLHNLRELELDRNSIFSLNSETFSGLKKLQRLDLSANSLEVIGDNTFLPLVHLKTLNLERNKIQMLDEKAFNGLGKLAALTLAHNKLTSIDNAKTFEGLDALFLLTLKSNQLTELKTEVMAPILRNLYGNSSNLDVEDNNFPCDCRLEWFISLMNKTQNQHLKLAIDNLKCLPDSNLRELWSKASETEKTGDAVEEEQAQPNTDYEYYDEAQLNGKLFYIDVRDLINCTKRHKVSEKPMIVSTKAISSPTVTKPKTTSTTEHVTSPISSSPTSIGTTTTTFKTTEQKEVSKPNTESSSKSKETFTTVRLATVSAKPVEHNFSDQDHHMASDEARPEKIKAHRSIQDDVQETPKDNYSSGSRNIDNLAFITFLLSIRMCLF